MAVSIKEYRTKLEKLEARVDQLLKENDELAVELKVTKKVSRIREAMNALPGSLRKDQEIVDWLFKKDEKDLEEAIQIVRKAAEVDKGRVVDSGDEFGSPEATEVSEGSKRAVLTAIKGGKK